MSPLNCRSHQWMLLFPVYILERPPLQGHTTPDFERDLCGVARELTLKNMKLINSSK